MVRVAQEPTPDARKGLTMEAIGGLLELWVLATAALAVLYFIVEPLFCWVTYAIGRLLGFGKGE